MKIPENCFIMLVLKRAGTNRSLSVSIRNLRGLILNEIYSTDFRSRSDDLAFYRLPTE